MIVPNGGLVTEDGKEIGRQLCPSLVTHPDFIPVRSRNNDIATVERRINAARNSKEPPAVFATYAREFVKLLVGDGGKGSRWSISDVIEFQARPTQRGRSNKVKHWFGQPSNIAVQSFMKGESYGKPNAPRNISTVPTGHNLQLSAYTYAFKRDVLYPTPWYMPGKKPADIAARVVELSRRSPFLTESDFTMMDGSISQWLTSNVSHAMYLAWSSLDERAELKKLLDAELCASAYTAAGIQYDPEFSQLSGSPTTTDKNTATNAFVMYAAARYCLKLEPNDAFNQIGAVAGDDGVSAITARALEEVARCLGLKLKCEERHGNLTFLGRVFYHADSGQVGSVQDPERTWRKLHLSFAPRELSDMQALANRAEGYLTLDPVAPVTSDWCRTIKRLTGMTGHVTDDGPYHAWLSQQDEQYGGWPQMPRDLAFEAIAWRLNRSPSEIRDLSDSILRAQCLDDLTELWSNPPHEIPYTVQVNGLVYQGGVDISVEQSRPYRRTGEKGHRGPVMEPATCLARRREPRRSSRTLGRGKSLRNPAPQASLKSGVSK